MFPYLLDEQHSILLSSTWYYCDFVSFTNCVKYFSVVVIVEEDKKNQGFTKALCSSILCIILQDQYNMVQAKKLPPPPFFFWQPVTHLFEGGSKHELSVYLPNYSRKLHLKFH